MATKFPVITPFSKAFGYALSEVMQRRGVSAAAAARAIKKKAGASYVTERLNGLRAMDTDVIAGVALVADVEPSTIVREVLAEMKKRGGGTIVEFPAAPSGPGSSDGDSTFGEQEAAYDEGDDDEPKGGLGDE